MNIILFTWFVLAWVAVGMGALLAPFIWVAHVTGRIALCFMASMVIVVPIFTAISYWLFTTTWVLDTFDLDTP